MPNNDSPFSLLDLAASEIENISSPPVVPEGEYEISIRKVSPHKTKSGNPALLVEFDILASVSDGRTPRARDFFNLPYRGCDPAARVAFNNHLAAFRLSFGIAAEDLAEVVQSAFQNDPLPERISEFDGMTGRALIWIEEQDGFPPRNSIRRYLQ